MQQTCRNLNTISAQTKSGLILLICIGKSDCKDIAVQTDKMPFIKGIFHILDKSRYKARSYHIVLNNYFTLLTKS